MISVNRWRNRMMLCICLLACCNPYTQYIHTHYHMIADLDPETGMFKASLQMVFVPRSNYRDSISFCLNGEFSIHSLTAQGLERYGFYKDGRLVLYLQDPVAEGDQLHISLSYSGNVKCALAEDENHIVMDTACCWYPRNDDIQMTTSHLRIRLPEGYVIEDPHISGHSSDTWQIRNREPAPYFRIRIKRNILWK